MAGELELGGRFPSARGRTFKLWLLQSLCEPGIRIGCIELNMAQRYERVPNTDEASSIKDVLLHRESNSRRRLILFVVSVIAVAFVSFKAGQWWSDAAAVPSQSPPPPPSSVIHSTSPVDTSEPIPTDIPMHDHGKISVG